MKRSVVSQLVTHILGPSAYGIGTVNQTSRSWKLLTTPNDRILVSHRHIGDIYPIKFPLGVLGLRPLYVRLDVNICRPVQSWVGCDT